MDTGSIMLKDLLAQLKDPSVIQKWKEGAAKSLRDLAVETNPFRGLKASPYYFYVDTKSKTYAIILQGVKPNLGHIRGFGAPVDKRELAPEPIHIKTPSGWKTTHTQRQTAGFIGARPLATHYYGVSGQPTRFFGLKRAGKVEAFGITPDGEAVPVYSEYGFVEYVSNLPQFEETLVEAGFHAIEGQ